MEYREFLAKTVDEAIIKASIELESPSESLDIQILNGGSTGFLGFGIKSARIKVCKKELIEIKEEPVIPESVKSNSSVQKRKEETEKADIIKQEPNKDEQRYPKTKKPDYQKREEKTVVVRSEEEVAKMKKAAEEFLSNVFRTMELNVNLQMKYTAAQDNLDIDLMGGDMGILIGKRGQTLDSLQYLTSLVINKGAQGYVRVKLDTEDYRSRRKETLENLSKSIAYKVRKTRKSVSLEPMNPYERRIIHSTLQGNKYVETSSEGNEPYRHVVVRIKR